AMRMGMVGSTGTLIVGWVVVASVALTLVWVLWAVGQQFLFSFGKSRYPTRTERKRMQHQKKTGRDDKTEILERKIPEQRDR
ncbi:MAG: hypothetical protein QGH94_20515, partial [Phycisphaerae bacterium]|nr:hypothetical protein [Phycisphaerae bacterium]